MGQRPNGGVGFALNAVIDEIRIWNVARSQTQIQENLYRRLIGNESGLVGYWRMDEAAGGQAKDATANANHGVITGAAWSTREVIAPLSAALKVDWDGDGVYDDVTADLLDLSCQIGRDAAFGSVVAGSMTAVLRNESKKYALDTLSPISANLRPYRAFTLELLADQTPFPWVSGKVLRFTHREPDPGDLATVTLVGRDLFQTMEGEARVDTLQNTTSKTLAETVLLAVGVGTDKRVISIVGDPISFAFGERRSARAWMDAISLLGYRQFVDRQGRYVLLDRLTGIAWKGDSLDSAALVEIETTDEGLTNRARVLVHPYKAHTTDHIIWSSGEAPFTLLAGEERTLIISFRDSESGAQTGAISLTTPASTLVRSGTLANGSAAITGLSATTDLATGMGLSGTGIPAGATIKSIDNDSQITISAAATASGAQSLTFSPMDLAATNVDGSGDRTADLTVTLVGNPSTSAQLKVKNTSLTDLKVTTLRIRGKLAVPQDVQAVETSRVTDYPDLYRELDADLIQETGTATTVLQYLLQRFATPARRYRASWTDADLWPSVVLEADINAIILMSAGGTRLNPAMTALRGMDLRMRSPMVLDASLDLDFVSLAAGPSASVLDNWWQDTV